MKYSQSHRILQLVKRKAGAANYELVQVSLKYSSRISELRRDGHNIVAKRVSRHGHPTGTWRYFLVDNNTPVE